MSEALVHIGLHKTGTTAFQKWATLNADSLLAGHDIRVYRNMPYNKGFESNPYELTLLALRPGRTIAAMSLEPEWPLEDWRRKVTNHCRKQVVENESALLISAESLSLLRHEDEVRVLQDLLAPRKMRVAVCLRERDSWLRSYEAEFLSKGWRPSDLRGSHLNIGPDTWLVEWDEMLRVWRKVLGDDNVVAFSYEDAMAQFGSSIPGVLTALGIPAQSAPPWRGFVANVSAHSASSLGSPSAFLDHLRRLIRSNPFGWPLQVVESALRRVRLFLTSRGEPKSPN